MSEYSILAVTMGDPAGIGPQVIVDAWREPAVHRAGRLLVIGHAEVMRRAVAHCGAAIEVREVDSPESCVADEHVLPCLRAGSDAAAEVRPGEVDARGGQAAFDALTLAIDLTLAGRTAGIVTGPLSKSALWKAGHRYPGHTEILAERCGVPRYAMMLYLGGGAPVVSSTGMGVIHATLHTSLRKALDELQPERIFDTVFLAAEAFRGIKGTSPRVAVCALNPHAGEDGLFGDEETTMIVPAILKAKAAGIDVSGPYPADSLMPRARDGEFDAVVAMYHDQGHIAVKLLGMRRAVNVTLGLPIVRTSVAHGTAFDIAWRAPADSTSMKEAILLAARLAAERGVKGARSRR